jgi:glutamyl-tRNA synthetase
MVRRTGGMLRLRIDDIDAPRVRPEYIDDIFRTLEWMNLDWNEGPKNSDDQTQEYSQSLRAARYNEIIRQLIGTGKVFACKCSRKELSENNCSCKSLQLSLGTPDTALRISTPGDAIVINDKKMGKQEVFLENEMKDFVIRRKDGVAAYQVASMADDIDYDINLIVRGEDLLPSTAAQLYLASLIGAEIFSQIDFYHHPLLTDEHGRKLSKSAGSISIKAMREGSTTPEKLYVELSRMTGLQKECISAEEMLGLPKVY